MRISEYQCQATRTINTSLEKEQNISNMIFGILGEGGEIADHLKKHFYQGHSLDVKHLEEEIGDLMWYIVNLATIYDLSMETILDKNIEKLHKRYKVGFTKRESINRAE